MSLLGIIFSGSAIHWSNDGASQVTLEAFNASEYLKVIERGPAFLPNTPRSLGPSLSSSREWQHVQRFPNTSCPRFGSAFSLAACILGEKAAAWNAKNVVPSAKIATAS